MARPARCIRSGLCMVIQGQGREGRRDDAYADSIFIDIDFDAEAVSTSQLVLLRSSDEFDRKSVAMRGNFRDIFTSFSRFPAGAAVDLNRLMDSGKSQKWWSNYSKGTTVFSCAASRPAMNAGRVTSSAPNTRTTMSFAVTFNAISITSRCCSRRRTNPIRKTCSA